MNEFTAKYESEIRWVLTGLDRLVLRGTLRGLAFPEGLGAYLGGRDVLLKDFGAYSESITNRVKEASILPVQALGLPVQYLASAMVSKEQIAQRIAREMQITEGPICALTSVEPCQTFEIYRNRNEKKLQLVNRLRKCLFVYHYQIHPEFGFMNARIQTWFPFSIQVCINGREWLARQMAADGLSYERIDNCFVGLEDPVRAQELMGAQLTAHWPELLNEITHMVNPLHSELFGHFGGGYYWSVHQSEWATDLAFSRPADLRELYPKLVRHAMTVLASPDVMRFLGRRLTVHGRVPGMFEAEVTSSARSRQEGVRIKHSVNGNSVKAYDKAYTDAVAILRIETTVNNPADFKVFRPKEGEDHGSLEWRSLRKGVADLHRRAEVSEAANHRYLNALSAADTTMTLEELIEEIASPTRWNGRSVRALRPLEREDASLLQAISGGEFAINGLRNRDIQRHLHANNPASTPLEAKRRSSQVTRMLRLLRAHRLIAKVPRTHRYQITKLGRTVITAVLTARKTPIRQLLPEAA